MEKLLSDLKWVNKWLGGNKVTLNGIRRLLKTTGNKNSITILDLGCGDGEMLRVCSDVLKLHDVKLRFIGVDANPFIINEAVKRSKDYADITFNSIDVFSEEYEELECDIVLCTLFLHHFKNSEIENILINTMKKAKVGVVVNDLERSRLAFVLFKIVSTLFVRTKTARIDGLISIARAFKKDELVAFSEKIKGKHRIRWKWAFRYQWIIQRL
jgi:2-polyprenyl-3-methyl-5-hydroxy-6-metoxy-1,4-benzoquinol methylase